MKQRSTIIDRLASRVLERATPAIREELRAVVDGDAQWEHVQRHTDDWIEIPTRLGDGSFYPSEPLKIRPGKDHETFLIADNNGGGVGREVKIVDLRRMLTVAEGSWR